MKDAKLHSAGGGVSVGDFANTGPNKDEDECVIDICHPHHIHGACGSKSASPHPHPLAKTLGGDTHFLKNFLCRTRWARQGEILERAQLIRRPLVFREFFGQGWMKVEKNERTPYILMNTKHFNDVSATAVGPSLSGVLQGLLRIQDTYFARLQNMR